MATSIYTLATLKEQAYSRLENNQLFFPPAQITSLINECIRVINLFTGFYMGTVTAISQAGQLVYSTPAGMLYPQRASFEGQALDPISLGQIAKDYRTWATDNTDKDGPVARWVPIGINYYCLHPLDAKGGGSIAITGVLETPLLVNDTDTMVLDDEWVNLIADYTGHVAALSEGGAPFADSASTLYTAFLRSLKAMTKFQTVRFPRWFVLNRAPLAEGDRG